MHSRRMEPMARSTYARCQGDRGVDKTSCIPMSDTCLRIITEDGISIAQQVSGELVKEKRFAQLLSRPFRRWVGGHIGMESRRS